MRRDTIRIQTLADPSIAVYQRLDAEMYFSTALTIVQPNNKGGRVLHHSVYILVVMLFSFGTRHLNASYASKNASLRSMNVHARNDAQITTNSSR
jgi:hypothetical protein